MSSPVACIHLNLLHRAFTVAYRSGFGRIIYWQELGFIVTTTGRLIQIVICLPSRTYCLPFPPNPAWSVFLAVPLWYFAPLRPAVFSRMEFNIHSDLKSSLCRNSCTQMCFRLSMSSVESTCSHNSSIWLSSCAGARASHGPFSVRSFARFLSIFDPPFWFFISSSAVL